MRTTHSVLAILFSVTVAACGGGGGGDASSGTPAPLAAVTLTAGNELSVTGAAFDTAAGVTDFGSLLPVGVQTSTEAPKQRVLSRLTASVVQKMAEQKAAPASVTGAVTIENCNGQNANAGTMQIDTLGGTTAARVTFSNCNFGTGEVINGNMSFSGMAQTSSSAAGTASIELTITETGFPTVTISGGFGFTYAFTTPTELVTLSGTHLTFTQGARSQGIFDFRFETSLNITTNVYTDSSRFTLSSSEIGGSFTVETATPFVTNVPAWFPHSGVAHISGAGSTRLRVTVLGNETEAANNQVKIERSTDGGATYGTPRLTTWAQLDS